MQKFNYQKSNKATGKIYIGLDHGYGNIKTAHRVFQTGIECYDEEPIVSTNYVKYRDKYYVIGESHLVYQGNKTESDDFYILTLAGLAEEMKYRGLHEADVVLAVGLPLAWVKTQAAEWRKYLMREKELDFSFRKERYKVHLCGLEIFPQGLAAVHNQGSMPGMFYTGWSLDRTCRWTAPTVSGISGRRSFNDRGRLQLFLYDRKIPGSGW